MKNLLLMRHGDTQPASAMNGRDHDRPLIPRGQEKCAVVAKYLAQHDMLPDLILASSATRSIQTAETLVHSLALSIEISALPELYQASIDTYLATLSQVPEQWTTVLIVGHNPTIQGFAQAMRMGGASVGGFDCAAIACMRFGSQTWEQIGYHSGNCIWFVTPVDTGLLE